jgi:hypothetical protein
MRLINIKKRIFGSLNIGGWKIDLKESYGLIVVYERQ